MKPTWGILQIMGHKAYAGYVEEEEVAGTGVLRIDVPAIEDIPAYTQYFGMGAFYALTPTSETMAREAAKRLRERPVEVYILPLYREKFLPEPHDDEPDYHPDEYDDGRDFDEPYSTEDDPDYLIPGDIPF